MIKVTGSKLVFLKLNRFTYLIGVKSKVLHILITQITTASLALNSWLILILSRLPDQLTTF